MRLPIPQLAICLLLLGASPASSEIYRWTDEEGREHFTQDLSQVPPRHRLGAERSSRQESSASPPARQAARRVSRSLAARGRVVVPVERAGSSMRVVAVLNGRVRAPFIIDTGASDVSVPRWVADELGLEIDEDTRTQVYQTANGLIEEPVITLGSIDLGGAVAENVAASVSSTMPIGLLGLSFFNRFSYQVDPARGQVTLEPNGLDESGVIRGGRSESEWRMQFRQLEARRSRVIARRDRLTPAHSRLREELEEQEERIDEQIEALEIEADRARVPHGWRR